MPVRVVELQVLGRPAYALEEPNGELTPSREQRSHPMLFESYYQANAALRQMQGSTSH